MPSLPFVLALCMVTHASAVEIDPGHIRVVVVGAGAAGIAAAQKLIEKGLDVTVLEAAEQIGGRIQSLNLSEGLAPGLSGWVEIGPQYVYGIGEFLNWLDKHNYIREIKDQQYVFLSDSRGQLEGDMERIAKEFDGLYTQMVSPMEDKDFPRNDKKVFSVGSYIEDSFQTLKLDETVQTVNKESKGLLDVIYDINIRGHKATIGADSLYDVAIHHYNTLKMQKIMLHQLKVPFMDIFKHFASGVPSEKILLNKAVTGIKFDKKTKSDHPVTVVTSEGDIIAAHHVIFTPSLGVLKAEHANIFKPALSAERVKAIKSIGFGKVEKIFAVYKEPFWREIKNGLTGMGILWEIDVKVDYERRYSKKPWYRTIESVNVSPYAENVLEVELCGEVVEYKSLQDEEQLAEDLTDFLKKFIKNVKVPKPESVTMTSWWANPFTRGTKSYFSYDSVAEKVGPRNLSKSAWEYVHQGVKVPGLMFAGEATHPEYFSTVQGAIESGWREANRLFKAYNL